MGRQKKNKEKDCSLCTVSKKGPESLGTARKNGEIYNILTQYPGKKEEKKQAIIKTVTNPKYVFEGYALVLVNTCGEIVQVFRDEIGL